MKASILNKKRRTQRRRRGEFSNNTLVLRGDRAVQPAGKHTEKPVTNSSNEVPDTMHVNKERLKPKCAKHTHSDRNTHT